MRSLVSLSALTMLLVSAGCLSTVTRITSEPEGAKVYLDGELIGTTPFAHHDRETIPTRHRVQIELEGYRIEEFYLDRYGNRLPPKLMFRLRPLEDDHPQAASPRSDDEESGNSEEQAMDTPGDEKAVESPPVLQVGETLLED